MTALIKTSLHFTAVQHSQLKGHLFPGDSLEAAAIVLCRDAGLARTKLMAVNIIPVPHSLCARTPGRLTWPGQYISEAIDESEAEGLSILLIHSHPGGFRAFSEMDNESDHTVFRSVFEGWSGAHAKAGHGSGVMMPDGEIICRLYDPNLAIRSIHQIQVSGDDIRFFWSGAETAETPMAFGSEMTATLSRLHTCVVGVSGTGSVIAEQAARMGFGKITLIDFDRVEHKNLNRILNSTVDDADNQTLKVQMYSRALYKMRTGLDVVAIPESIESRKAIEAAGDADIIFSCVDSSEGRHIVDRIAQSFMIPLIDMGVTIPTRRRPDGSVAVADVLGRIDYVYPGGSTLGDRGVYTGSSLRAEYLRRVAPETFSAELNAGYIKGAVEEAPSVISLNMRAASTAMLEFVARAFPFRHASNAQKVRSIFSLADGDEEHFSNDDFSTTGVFEVGSGMKAPLLGLPSLED